MTPISFVADNVADALEQIRGRLGPSAVVVDVRRHKPTGFSALWQKPRVEILAGLPVADPPSPASSNLGTLLDLRSDESLYPSSSVPVESDMGSVEGSQATNRFSMSDPRPGRWRTALLLEKMGLSPLNTERAMDRLRQQHGSNPPLLLRDELALARSALMDLWKGSRANRPGIHLVVGPPGSGKSTAICKWLTQAVLLEGSTARVWRLDVPRANTAELLSVHCEILQVPVERTWSAPQAFKEDHLFIDLPGIDIDDAQAFAALETLLPTMPVVSLSLVLNAAYDMGVLHRQVRAFSRLPLTDLIVTHLDEEPRWSKLWNLVLGTNYSLSFLSAGQNIPGQFLTAQPEALLPEQLRISTATF